MIVDVSAAGTIRPNLRRERVSANRPYLAEVKREKGAEKMEIRSPFPLFPFSPFQNVQRFNVVTF
jgi:hypothetical protein